MFKYAAHQPLYPEMAIKITNEGSTECDMKRWIARSADVYASNWTEDQNLAYGKMVNIVAPIPIPERHLNW